MAVFFYNIFLILFRLGTHLAAPFNAKAKKWVTGRKNIFQKLEAAIPPGEKVVWMHCASLGEFEQGRPLLEKMKQQYPSHKFLLTFFSPSGYEVRKNYDGADWVFYLPMDGPRNAKRFLEIVHPSLVIFVKYEFWFYYLKKVKYRNIPLILISALFRKDMSFFKWYGKLQRKMLSRFDHLFVQNESSKKLVDEIGLGNISSVSGDTRFDRVIEIAEQFQPIPPIEQFIGNSKTIVAGSTWPEDEDILSKAIVSFDDPSLSVIIAPHEISEKHLATLEKLFPDALRYSNMLATINSPEFEKAKASFPSLEPDTTSILIIDNVGMLSRLYKYGTITFVGGAFRKSGVHNVLEAAVYNKPVIFGPYYEKYFEAVELVRTKGAIAVKSETNLRNCINTLLENAHSCYDISAAAAGNYVRENAGATKKIIQFIQEKRLLTN